MDPGLVPPARRMGKARKMICIVDRSSIARDAVKLAQTAYTCLLLPTRSFGYGGHGAERSQACADCVNLSAMRAFAHPLISIVNLGTRHKPSPPQTRDKL